MQAVCAEKSSGGGELRTDLWMTLNTALKLLEGNGKLLSFWSRELI